MSFTPTEANISAAQQRFQRFRDLAKTGALAMEELGPNSGRLSLVQCLLLAGGHEAAGTTPFESDGLKKIAAMPSAEQPAAYQQLQAELAEQAAPQGGGSGAPKEPEGKNEYHPSGKRLPQAVQRAQMFSPL